MSISDYSTTFATVVPKNFHWY